MDPSQSISRWPSWALPALTAVWMGSFVYLGLASRLPDIPGLTGRGESVASFGHFTTTLVLAVLVYGLIRSRGLDRPTLGIAISSVVAATLAGGIVEVLQSFSRTRSPQLADLWFDGLGAVVGVGLMGVIDARPSLRPKLVEGAHVLGAVAVSLTIAAFFIWPPITPEEVAAYCPAGVEERRVPRVEVEAGIGSRVSDGLLALYSFEDSSDDVSGVAPALNLVLEGGAALRNGELRITGVDGVARSARAATKVDDAVKVTDSFTVEAWVRPRDLLQRGPARIVTASGSTSLSDVNFHLGQERTCLSFRVAAGGGAAEWLLIEGVFSAPQPAWHIAVTYERGSIGVFAEGAHVESRVVEPGPLDSWAPDFPLYVGNEATLNRPFRGDILLVAIYGRALTATEIASNYAAGALTSPP